MESEAVCQYGHVESTGGATRGRASSTPWAVIWGSIPKTWDVEPYKSCPYRYWTFVPEKESSGRAPWWSWSECPQACYCWVPDVLYDAVQWPDPGVLLTLADLVDGEAASICKALLVMCDFVQNRFELYESAGHFNRRARCESRQVKKSLRNGSGSS